MREKALVAWSMYLSVPNRKIRTGIVLGLLVVAAAAAYWAFWRSQTPKRFGVVVPGRLYRSGEITPREMVHVAREFGVRTVLSLLNPAVPESGVERAAAEALGLRWVNVPLPGDGASTAAQREQIKAILFNEHLEPLLVHCAAGANRTGLSIGMYRIHRQGWPLDQVLAEMREYGFEDLPKHENLRQALKMEWRIRASRE